MANKTAPNEIRLRGVRHNNLKNFDLDLPLGKLIVFTGPSGSGKSSLAFDTLFAEGQRRYIETFSPYARQFFDRMDKPQVDHIEGIPPAIAIEQRNTVKTSRSTVGTMTEICDYAKVLWASLAQLYCRGCGKPVEKESPQRVWQRIFEENETVSEALVTFDVPLSEKLSLEESLHWIGQQGYQRLLIGSKAVRLEESLPLLQGHSPKSLTVIQDRVKLEAAQRKRFIEACEQAYHFGKGKLAVHVFTAGEKEASTKPPQTFSNRFHCAACDLEYRPPSPALFSFNHPLGACPACRGFGRVVTIDYNLVLPDHTRTLAEGVVKPWQTGQSAECQEDLLKFCRKRGVPTDVPFNKLPEKFQRWVIEGDPGYGKNAQHEWPRAWYGIKGYFRWLESKTYKMHVRVLLSRYRAYTPCPDCGGKRFQPEALQCRIASGKSDAGLTIADFYELPLSDARQFVERQMQLRKSAATSDPLTLALREVRLRLQYLEEVGLGYLTLDRATRTLSGGETERVNLATCLGSGLVNTLFVLDEPTVGLHPRDTQQLVKIMERLRDAGNTMVVVEHEPAVIRSADEIVDLGPGHGESGGQVVFQGTFQEIKKSARSLTGQYLSGKKAIAIPKRRPVNKQTAALKITRATRHNLKDFSATIPLGRLVCVTGVSGSGKTTLMRDVLMPALEARLKTNPALEENEADAGESDERDASSQTAVQLQGWESLGRVLLVDQSPLGKTPRSTPAVYIGAFDAIREFFARTDSAKQRGLNASAFSFNSPQGQCERCRGAGFEKIEMQFLSDVFVRCPACDGKRYRPHLLEVRVENRAPTGKIKRSSGWNISDFLEATADEAVAFLAEHSGSIHAERAIGSLSYLLDAGLGYLRLGQPVPTLSGGECQRLKLVAHLAEFQGKSQKTSAEPSLFLFDEPTTGLHYDDVRVLLKVFQNLVDTGHSVLIVEHNLELIKCADWVIDLGPEGGSDGGRLVVAGTPETVAAHKTSHTGRALKSVLQVKGK